MIEEKKKSKAFPIFVLFLGIVLIALGVVCQLGYLDPVLEQIGLKEASKEENNNTGENTNSTTIEEGSLEVNNEQVVSLYNKVNQTASQNYSDYYFKQDKLLVENMDNQFRLLLAFNNTTSQETTRSDEEMQNAYRDVFGEIEYQPETFDANCIEYTYDAATLTYTQEQDTTVCPSTGCNSKREEILSAYQYADRIEITTVVAFVNTCELKYYKDYEYSDMVFDGQEYSTGILTTNQDKFDHYVYTFTLTDGKYVFTGVAKAV